MNMQTKKVSLKQQIGFGLSAFLFISPLALCFAAAAGQSLLPALICTVACAAFSVKSENRIAAPHPLFTVPFIYVLFGSSLFAAVLSVCLGALLCLVLQNKTKKIQIPDSVSAGGALGLCLGATVLLTNAYFGIGAFGTTPLEMLSSYRSLGFHPHFMGLLTGTITLFTMITYPFKFKKLSKIIPAPFITIAIPYILNLFLNPDRNYTAIDETVCLTPINKFSLSQLLSDFNLNQIPNVLKTAFVFFLIFSVLDKTASSRISKCSIFSLFPVTMHKTRGFGTIPAITVIILSAAVTLLLPGVFSRIPLHCVGSMLIVFAWQSLPYKKIALIFTEKKHKLINGICFISCAVAFIVSDVFTASIICIFICVISTLISGKELE